MGQNIQCLPCVTRKVFKKKHACALLFAEAIYSQNYYKYKTST